MDVWAGWVERACQINEYAAPERERSSPRNGHPAGEGAPGTDFNRRGSWAETGLFDAGWTWARKSGEDRGLLCRPGKDRGTSASAGMVTSKENGWPLFFCWSTSVGEFVPEQPYSRFAVFAAVRHGGDYSAAAKELASRGYGERMPDVGAAYFGVTNGEPAPADPRLFRWMSELRFRPENDKWLWHGFLSRGGVTLLNALWKAGKSTLLAHLIRAFDGRSDEFLGRAIVPARVLYVSEEHEDLWAERRDELNIGDHVGIVTREHLPFRGRSSPAEWAALIGNIVKAVGEFRFDLVVFDTISKLWPVREENDAGQVEDALMPLWGITNTGAGLLLVHHNRKTGGKEFTGSRGSGGLPAFAETIMEFARTSDDNAKDRNRLLTSGGRYRETPTKWLIELAPAGYVAHGDPDEMTPDQKAHFGIGNQVNADDWTGRAMTLIPDDPMHAPTVDELQAKIKSDGRDKGVRREDLLAWLAKRVDAGELLRMGRGVKNSPYRWYKPNLNGEYPSDPPGYACGTASGIESDDTQADG